MNSSAWLVQYEYFLLLLKIGSLRSFEEIEPQGFYSGVYGIWFSGFGHSVTEFATKYRRRLQLLTHGAPQIAAAHSALRGGNEK